jgi:hypothetical protein
MINDLKEYIKEIIVGFFSLIVFLLILAVWLESGKIAATAGIIVFGGFFLAMILDLNF